MIQEDMVHILHSLNRNQLHREHMYLYSMMVQTQLHMMYMNMLDQRNSYWEGMVDTLLIHLRKYLQYTVDIQCRMHWFQTHKNKRYIDWLLQSYWLFLLGMFDNIHWLNILLDYITHMLFYYWLVLALVHN